MNYTIRVPTLTFSAIRAGRRVIGHEMEEDVKKF